jgi:hypothetical protein
MVLTYLGRDWANHDKPHSCLCVLEKSWMLQLHRCVQCVFKAFVLVIHDFMSSKTRIFIVLIYTCEIWGNNRECLFRVPLPLDRISLSQIRYVPSLKGQVPLFIFPRNRVAQVYGGDIWTSHNAEWSPCWQSQSQSQSHFTTDGQSVSMSWCRAQFGTFDQRYYFFFF